MKKQISQVVLAFAFVTSALFVQGCTDTEVGAAAGAVAGAVIGGAIASGNSGSTTYYPPHSYPQTYCYYDYYGYYRCDRYYPSHRRFAAVTMNDSQEYSFTSTDERVADVAAKYEISHYAATYVVRAIVLAQQNDVSGLKDLGLDKGDMKDLYDGKALSSAKINTMSKKLLLKTDKTQELVARITADTQAARKK